MDQIPPRIRKIVDFIGYPILNRTQTICKLLIFSGPKGRSLLRTHYFFTKPVFEMYDSVLPQTKICYFNEGELHIRNIEEINSRNFSVICFNPKTYKLEIKPVNAYIKHYVNKDCYEITTSYNKKIRVTGDHSIFAWVSPWKCKGSSKLRKGKLKPIPVRELKVGDWIAIPTKLPVLEKDIEKFDLISFVFGEDEKRKKKYDYGIRVKFEGVEKIIKERKREIKKILLRRRKSKWYYKKSIKDILPMIKKGYLPLSIVKELNINIPENAKITWRYDKCSINSTIKCDGDFLWFLGFYLAEGSSSDYEISLCSEKHLLLKAKDIGKRVFGVEFNLYEYEGKVPVLKCSNMLLAIFIRKITENLEWILQLPLSKLKYFLYGWWQGDGYHNKKWKKYGIRIITANRNYAEFLRKIFLRFGLVATTIEEISPKGKKKYWGKVVDFKKEAKCYAVVVQKVDNPNILEWDKGVTQRLHAKRIGDLALVKIKNIKKFNYRGFVYDLSIKGYENFVANDICCHNTNEEVGDLIDDVTGTWKKAISPTTQLKYQKEFIGLQQPIQIQNPQKVEIKNIQVNPLRNIKLPRLKLIPDIKVDIEQPELSLEDAENEKIWKDEEKAIKEKLKEAKEIEA